MIMSAWPEARATVIIHATGVPFLPPPPHYVLINTRWAPPSLPAFEDRTPFVFEVKRTTTRVRVCSSSSGFSDNE